MDGQAALYDEDVFAWSEHQARLLRGLATSGLRLPNDLDLHHVAEEIEDVGRSEFNSVLSHLEGMLIHLAKAASSPHSQPVRHWLDEVDEHQRQALRRVTSAMRRRVDLDEIWRTALRRADGALARYGETLAALPAECPFALDDLLAVDGDGADALLARLLPARAPDP